jgi:hypothetical protein
MPAVNLDLKERAMFKRVAIGIGILVVLGGGGVAFGAIPGADGVIKGCYDNSGSLKVIDSAATCNAGSTTISWNQKGPKGDGFVHRGVFDNKAVYVVGDVVYDPATSYNTCGNVTKDRPAGSYVKIKAGTDKWQQGDPTTASIYSPCMVPDMWALMTPRGEKGQKGDAGPNNLYWARLSADGKLLAKNAPVAWFGNWGAGKYYLGFTGVDTTKCAITVTPNSGYNHYPISAATYGIYSNIFYIDVTQHRNNGWPLVSEGVNAEISVVAACGGI